MPQSDRSEQTTAKPQRSRDPERTQNDILNAAVQEFARHGYHGARVGRIAKSARCNARMIYHYFGGKEPLYIAALDKVYASIRNREAALNLSEAEPVKSMRRLVEFTFDYFAKNQEFLSLTRTENMLGGKFIRRSHMVSAMSQPLTLSIGRLLDRGLEAGLFRHRPDPLQLYVSIVSLSAHHINNASTLSATFAEDLSDPAWLEQRRRHVIEMILRDLGVEDAWTA